MRISRQTLAVLLMAPVLTLSSVAPPQPRVIVLSGSRSDGSATDLWLTILRRRLSRAQYDSVAGLRLARSAQEKDWARLVRARAGDWPRAAADLQALFDSTRVDSVRVVLGDRGAEDAFTHDSLTLGMDLAALQRIYGDATRPENAELLDRLFRHEFVHVLQKRWLARHPVVPASPFETAVLDAWEEGLGNYYSLSTRWRPTGGLRSPAATKALEELEPGFAVRMSALACADSASAVPLLAGLSSGPFDRKWGALPVALWLQDEVRAEPEVLHWFAVMGPPAVWALAAHHLPDSLADTLAAARRRARSCGPSRRS